MANTSIRVDTVGLGIAWKLGETYRVEIDEGFVNQDGGLQLPITGGTLTTFTTPAFPPQIGNTVPTHTSTAPNSIQNISFGINRANLSILGGNVTLNLQSSPNVVVKTITVSNIAGQGNVVAMNIVGNLLASQTYFVTMTANIFQDNDGFKNNAITNSSSFRFISPAPPSVSATTPNNDATAEKGFTTINLQFDRTVSANIGNIYVYKANTNALVKTIAISSVTISGANVAANIVGNIDANEKYYVRSNAHIVNDSTLISSNIAPGNIFVFTSPTNPNIISTSPTSNANLLLSNPTITATFDRNITNFTGNIFIKKQSDNSIVKTYNVSELSFNTNTLSIDTINYLDGNEAYYVTMDANLVQDATQIKSQALTDTNFWRFTAQPTVPSAPVILSAFVVSNVSANISYISSVYNGGFDITSYTAVSSPDNITGTLSTSGNGNITVNGLVKGTTYTFIVYATNSLGNSANSSPSNSVTATGTPSPPTLNSVALVSNSSVLISYTAPANNGANTIVSYTAVSTPGNITSTVNQSTSGTITLTGLSADSYTFKVYATNYYGDSNLSIVSNTVPVGANVYYDENYSNVTVLATADTSSNAWIIDQSINPGANIRLTSGESRVTNEYIYNNASFLLNGFDYINSAVITFYRPAANLSNLTLEAYVKITNPPGHGAQSGLIFNIDDNAILQHLNNDNLTIKGFGMTVNVAQGNNVLGTLSRNAWHHIAVCKQGTNLRIFINGTQIGSTQTVSGSVNVNEIFVGGTAFYGHVDQIRFTPGIARYTSSFTPPGAFNKNIIYYT